MRALVLAALALLLLAPPALPQDAGEEGMRDSNRAAAVLLAEKWRRDRPDDYETLCRIRRSDVLVVSGRYDHVDLVLAELSVPYAEIRPESLARTSLAGVRIVLVNCPGEVGRTGVAALREFVAGGGLLFTTDWALRNVLEPAFPGTVAYTGRPTRDDVVAIRVVRPEHLFLHHLIAGDDRCVWWLENRSYPIRVLDPRRVEVLIESREMEERYGERPIAVTFRAGKGRVIHVVSHFYLQRSDLRGDRDRIPAKEMAKEMGFGAESPAARRLADAGVADAPAGEVRSAFAAQQLLLNVLVAAKRTDAAIPAPPTPPPPAPIVPRPAPPRPPAAAAGAWTARETCLRDAAGGERVKRLAEGLPLRILRTSDGWIEVATPAGETGWLPAADVRKSGT